MACRQAGGLRCRGAGCGAGELAAAPGSWRAAGRGYAHNIRGNSEYSTMRQQVMTDVAEMAIGGRSIAIAGLSCRYPEADDPPALLDLVTTGRRAFRRIPPCRLDLADYYSPDPRIPNATYSTRAALIEGWQFDPGAFQLPDSLDRSTDPVRWLALETAARALAAAGFPGGSGLPGDRSGVIIGSTSAGGRPATVASAIAGQFGFRGGGFSIDGGSASSLVAVVSACLALAAGELDVAIAGGVDLSLDPAELIGMAKAGLLATGDMAVYDQHPTGFLPGEGCGMVLLMRSADARAAQLPVYAEILGWGVASAGLQCPPRADQPGEIAATADGQLLALRDAYRKSGIDPVDVQLIEGGGAGIAADEEAELTALTALRAGARRSAALGSIAANIGNTRAAAGVAGLIKTVLAISSGVLPPATGFRAPHPILREPGAVLRLPAFPERWPEGERLAGVSAMDPGGLNVHLVLRGPHGQHLAAGRRRQIRPSGTPVTAISAAGLRQSDPRNVAPQRPAVYLLHAPDRAALGAILSRIADVASWLSDGEMGDLASQLTVAAASQGPARVAIVATRQEQLARLAAEAITILPALNEGLLAVRPGIFAADGADGRVTLLLPEAPCPGTDSQPADQRETGLDAILAALAWLDALGVDATTAVGHGVGELAGLVWAGCITAAAAQALSAARGAGLTGPAADRSDLLSSELSRALSELAIEFTPPRRRLISSCTGTELSGPDGIAAMLRAGPASTGQLSSAGPAGAAGASLLLETGPGRAL